jgi:SAM-dependent methyltransferase
MVNIFNQKIESIERIRLTLKDLKSSTALKEIYWLYRSYLDKFFVEGAPITEYFVLVSCPICKSSSTEKKLILDNISYEECTNCRAIYTPMMLRDDVLKEMYRSGEYQKYFRKLVLSSQEIRRNVLERRKCQQISSCFKQAGRLLDVGCGSGSFLSVCGEYGWEISGVDPSEGAVKSAKERYGIDIWKGVFEEYDQEERFDCITFFGIEHLQDPMQALRRTTTLLEPNGIVMFEAPSADSFLLDYVIRFPFEITRFIEAGRHYLFFSQATIGYICKSYGFDIEYIETNGLDIETILLGKNAEAACDQILNMQEALNSKLLGDHYRVVLRKRV